MSLIKSKQKQIFKWKEGDLITAIEACRLLGYKSANALNIPERRSKILRDFERLGLTLTTDIQIAGSPRYIRAEIEAYLDASVSTARELNARHSVPARVAA